MQPLIQSIFPENIKDTKVLIKEITNKIQYQDWIGYAGYSEKEYLTYSLENKYSDSNFLDYQPLNQTQIIEVETIIQETFQICSESLRPTHNPTYFFILPWFPDEETRKVFNGIMGWVDYQDTVNIYIHPSYDQKELKETIAHEYNHAVWYHYHGGHQQTLFESMIVEGLAEHFREQTVGGETAPWCKALDEKECAKIFNQLKPNLERTDLYESVFFGDEEHKKWTGYSLGYWLIGQYIKKQESINWNEMMKLKEEDWKYLLEKKES